jgi:hypothetical protein
MKAPNSAIDSNAMSKHVKKAVIFVGLTFLANWSFALLFYVLGGRWGTPVGITFGAAYIAQSRGSGQWNRSPSLS